MAYTTELKSGFGYIVHNGDYSGTITFVVSSGEDEIHLELPFEDILGIVADWKRYELVRQIESESEDQKLVMDW